MRIQLRLMMMFLVVITGVAFLMIIRDLLGFKAQAQSNLWLLPPFNGTHPITSYVDHETPFDKANNSIKMFNGEEYNNCPGASEEWTTQGPYCYDGHEGIDWAMNKNTPILAVASGVVV